MRNEVMEIGFCGKEEVNILGTRTCKGTLIARERHPDDNKSLEYSVQCDTCRRWWETTNPLKTMARLAKKIRL
jgi:hypothetical protein